MNDQHWWLLDLFCGAGGCSVGYERAGFDVLGIDVEHHPDYPYPIHIRDAMDVLEDSAFLNGFDVIHASPPCQAFTTMSNRWRGAGGAADEWPDLIGPVRDALRRWGGVYVIENVPGARSSMQNPMTLHGGMFGLGVYRPRLFETNAALLNYHAPQTVNPVGVYGKAHDGRLLFARADGTEQRAASSLAEAQAAMGIDWMGWDDLREAIPPAYTEFIGEQLIGSMEATA
jgi:DNA (cytosine-5)-methyltransferase 1